MIGLVVVGIKWSSVADVGLIGQVRHRRYHLQVFPPFRSWLAAVVLSRMAFDFVPVFWGFVPLVSLV